MPRARHSSTGRSAFTMIDAMFALVVVTTLITMFLATSGQQRIAERRMAQQRAAVQRAGAALHELQLGRALPREAEGTRYRLDRVEGGEAPPKRVWIRLTVEHEGRTAELIGIVPSQAVEGRL